MVSRLQRNEEPLNLAYHHLEEYLETKVRARKLRKGFLNREVSPFEVYGSGAAIAGRRPYSTHRMMVGTSANAGLA
jgi:hypothetical protein